jgi:hypothetical protein
MIDGSLIMRSRLLAVVAALTLAVTTGGLVVVSASPASAHCGGHTPHPDRYSLGGVSFKSGARIRSHPHTNCTVRGHGNPGNVIDVHCYAITGRQWWYVRNTTTGVQGWVRNDVLNWEDPAAGEIAPCP